MSNENLPIANRGIAGLSAQEEYITKDEMARRLKKSLRTIENWQRAGKIPFLKIGNSVLYRWSDVQQVLEQRFRIIREGLGAQGLKSEGNGVEG